MLLFLLNRPIAVTMTCLAILILGTVASSLIPVSLMPDIDIPQVTVQVSSKNVSARQLENTVVSQLRRQLMHVAHLADIRSETRDEKSIISLSFEYGTKMDFAFIEVNEKIDRAMAAFPRQVERPRVIKGSATDVPVYYLNLTLKEELPADIKSVANEWNALFPVSERFVKLSSFANHVIRKRLEQLPEVAMADISGLVHSALRVIPDFEKLEALHLTVEHLEAAMRGGNVSLGNLLIQDGQYQYNVRFSSTLSDKHDIENLYLRIEGRLVQLKDLASVVEHPQEREGMVTHNGKDAITIAIIKQTDAQMGELKQKLNELVTQFNSDYPNVSFSVSRDQTKLLDYSISNLSENLIWGAVLAFAVMFLFLKDFKSPLLIGVSMPASLIVSIIFFYLFDISINIISLSGLVLGLGMMIDNSIIVIDNITQHRERGSSLVTSCVNGTNEVFGPMLSSMLTSCAIFMPLIFLSGISGALFYDQAIAVAIGHFASLLVSVTLIPVYYRIVYGKDNSSGGNALLNRINILDYEALYERSFRWVMRNQRTVWAVVISFLIGGVILSEDLPRSKLPPVITEEILLNIDWNETIHPEENNKRVEALLSRLTAFAEETTALIGEQQFLLDKSQTGQSGSMIYFKARTPEALTSLQVETERFFRKEHPDALRSFSEADNFFNLIFPESEPPLVARLRPAGEFGERQNTILQRTVLEIQQVIPEIELDPILWQESMLIRTDPVKLMAYDIPFESLYKKLTVAFNQTEIFVLSDNQDFVPVLLGGKPKLISDVLSDTYVANKKGDLFPVREFLSVQRSQELKTITAGQGGEYYPVDLKATVDEAEGMMDRLKTAFRDNESYEVDFSGTVLSDQELMMDLAVILLISLALLYVILAAQFESLHLPVIVLIEVPIGIAGAFFFLRLFGSGINLMSMIGIIVMSGIIINDSILKLDTTNQLMKEGYSLLHALLVTGQRKLKPILMTSLTTVLAMSPLLFTSGLGAELQKPLAVALTGGMVIGTLVSLYFMPLCYYYLRRRKPVQ